MTPENKNLQLFADSFNLEYLIKKQKIPFLHRSYHHKQESIFQKSMYTRNWNIRFSSINSSQFKMTNINSSSKTQVIRKLYTEIKKLYGD